MRMGANIRASPGPKHHWPEMIEENEGTHRPAQRGGERATNLEAVAQIPDRGKHRLLDGHMR